MLWFECVSVILDCCCLDTSALVVAGQVMHWWTGNTDRQIEQNHSAQAGKQFQFALFRIVADLAAMAEAPRLRVPAASSRMCGQAA